MKRQHYNYFEKMGQYRAEFRTPDERADLRSSKQVNSQANNNNGNKIQTTPSARRTTSSAAVAAAAGRSCEPVSGC